MTEPVFASCADAVKNDLLRTLSSAVEELWSTADDGASPRELENAVWRVLLKLGRMLLAYLFGLQCRRSMEEDLRMRGVTRSEVRMRNERDYWMTIKTTLGEVRFPTFAYRDLSSGVASVARTSARDIFPLRPSRCRPPRSPRGARCCSSGSANRSCRSSSRKPSRSSKRSWTA